jgi:hypothetical protein
MPVPDSPDSGMRDMGSPDDSSSQCPLKGRISPCSSRYYSILLPRNTLMRSPQRQRKRESNPSGPNPSGPTRPKRRCGSTVSAEAPQVRPNNSFFLQFKKN